MVRVSGAVPLPIELPAEMVAVVVPAWVGVPEMSPVLALMLKPAGRLTAA